jgi:hypothetical protein
MSPSEESPHNASNRELLAWYWIRGRNPDPVCPGAVHLALGVVHQRAWSDPIPTYQWTRSQERLDSMAAAHDAGSWVEISEQELKEYGGWVALPWSHSPP